MKKERISVSVKDSVASLAERINSSSADEVILIIPKFSQVGVSSENFSLLRRETKSKKVFIESVDDDVLDFAEDAGFKAVNPLFAAAKRKTFDIIALEKTKIKPAPAVSNATAAASGASPAVSFEKPAEPEAELKEEETLPLAAKKSRRKFYFILASVLVIFIAAYAGLTFLSRTEVKIVTKKFSWQFEGTVSAAKNVSEVNADAGELPAELFQTKTKNVQMTFPATGRKFVEDKAGGKIAIFNVFSSASQKLVANTRFKSPEGKIFRLVAAATVPGARVDDGKIIPSSVEAAVVAEAAGEEYNIGPGRFSIPGFEGTPKYEGFYGESVASMTGGFKGEKIAPTDDDIAAAKEKARGILSDSLKSGLFDNLPAGFKLLEKASQFEVVKENVIAGDSSGNFGVFLEGRMTLVGFLEESLNDLLLDKAQKEAGEESLKFNKFDLEYGAATADFSSGKLTFPVKVSAVLEKAVDWEMLKNGILGKEETEIKTAVFALPGLERATISFWPRWVKTAPDDPQRVKIIVE